MDMKGEYRIEAPRQQVWDALNDPEILKRAIPGCEEIVKTSDTEMTAKVTAKVGPVKAKFQGAVTLSDIVPPESYTISGEGKGGAAGFAKGGAKVALAEDGAATILTYEVNANVGGKLAQIGSRLIDGTAKKMADDFFGNFATMVGGPAPAEADAGGAGAGRRPTGTCRRARSAAAGPDPGTAAKGHEPADMGQRHHRADSGAAAVLLAGLIPAGHRQVVWPGGSLRPSHSTANQPRDGTARKVASKGC